MPSAAAWWSGEAAETSITPIPLVSTCTRSAPSPRSTGRLAPCPKKVVETPGWRSSVSPSVGPSVSIMPSRPIEVALPISSPSSLSGPGAVTMTDCWRKSVSSGASAWAKPARTAEEAARRRSCFMREGGSTCCIVILLHYRIDSQRQATFQGKSPGFSSSGSGLGGRASMVTVAIDQIMLTPR